MTWYRWVPSRGPRRRRQPQPRRSHPAQRRPVRPNTGAPMCTGNALATHPPTWCQRQGFGVMLGTTHQQPMWVCPRCGMQHFRFGVPTSPAPTALPLSLWRLLGGR